MQATLHLTFPADPRGGGDTLNQCTATGLEWGRGARGNRLFDAGLDLARLVVKPSFCLWPWLFPLSMCCLSAAAWPCLPLCLRGAQDLVVIGNCFCIPNCWTTEGFSQECIAELFLVVYTWEKVPVGFCSVIIAIVVLSCVFSGVTCGSIATVNSCIKRSIRTLKGCSSPCTHGPSLDQDYTAWEEGA